MTKCKSVTDADRIWSKITLPTRESVNMGPCMRLQAAPLSLRYSLGLKWEVGPVLAAAPPGQACVCTPTPAELKVKQWEQMLAASSVQLKSKRGTLSLHTSKQTNEINWSHHGVSHVLLAVIRTLLAPVLVLELMEFVFPLLLLQLLLMTLLLNLPLVLQKLLLVLEC